MKTFNEINPSKEQEACIKFNSGDLIVNGVPGAGKSIVLLKRALNFYKGSMPGEKRVVLLTTFSNTLNDYTKDIFDQASIDKERMCITTLDSLCGTIYYKLFGWANVIEDKAERERYVGVALQKHYSKNLTNRNHRFYKVDLQFWCDEFLWIKQKNITNLQEYLCAERTGRGGSVRITREERKMVYGFFCEYCNVLNDKGKLDREDLYIRIIRSGKDLSRFTYKYVLVDEAQDLYFTKLKLLKMLTRECITIAADRAQKIYNTGFTWKELDIDIHGNASKTLHKTFRSTKQIVQLAESLSEVNRAYDKDASEYTDPVLPTIIGVDYPFIIRANSATEEKTILIELLKRNVGKNITIGLLYRNYLAKKVLIDYLNEAGFTEYQEIKRGSEWSLRTPGIKVVTLHSAKGLEFDTVIIPFFNNVYFPPEGELSKVDSEQVAEMMSKERNLLYVGMTRAKANLYMTYAGTVSPFLAEFNPEYYNYSSSTGESLEKPKRSFNPLQVKQEEIVKEKDILIAHVDTETKPRVFDGGKVADTKRWPFIGKKIGESVKVAGVTYVVDSIKKSEVTDQANQKNDEKRFPKSVEWDDIFPQLFGNARAFAEELKHANVPVATTIGSELMGADGDVIAEAEMAWEKEHVVYLREDQEHFSSIWKSNGWRIISQKDCEIIELFKGDEG